MKLNPANRSLDQFRAGLMYVGIVTVITIVIWVSVSVYSSYSKPTIDPDIEAIIKPLNPSLDNQVLIDYSSSRISPPEQFQIIATVKEGNKITQVLLDPYAIGTPGTIIPEESTPEESVLEEPISEESTLPETSTSSSELTP